MSILIVLHLPSMFHAPQQAGRFGSWGGEGNISTSVTMGGRALAILAPDGNALLATGATAVLRLHQLLGNWSAAIQKLGVGAGVFHSFPSPQQPSPCSLAVLGVICKRTAQCNKDKISRHKTAGCESAALISCITKHSGGVRAGGTGLPQQEE